MALVCDIKSESKVDSAEAAVNEDLEDGEIEDDEDEVPAQAPQPVDDTPIPKPPSVEKNFPAFENKHEKYERIKFERSRSKHEEKKKNHMTEAEKSVMFLHKLERMEREKREKYRREPVDDFASNIEKAIASVLKKGASDEELDEDKRSSRKRKKKERDRKKKQRKIDASPRSDELDEIEMLNMRGGSPEHKLKDISPRTEDTLSDETDYSTDKSGEERRDRRRDKRDRKMRNRERNRRPGERENKNKMSDQQPKDAAQLCVYYLQGKCQKGDDCQYSHESQPPMKWELCKFYLNDCCAKGDKCLYMHSDFPCKFYHTGQPCLEGDNCKFAHGKPLSDRLKQILFKHIETAPKDILGRFPRMNREEAAFKINQTQKQLEGKFGMDKKDSTDQSKMTIPSLFDISIPMPAELLHDDSKKEKSEKPIRNRPSRWQEADPLDKQNLQDQRKNQTKTNYKPFPQTQDQDMRLSNLPLTSNGDIDMRTLPPIQIQSQNLSSQPNSPLRSNMLLMMGPQKNEENRPLDIEQYKREAGFNAIELTTMDVDIRSIRGDTDIRNHNNLESMTGRDTDIRKMDIDSRQQQLELFDRRDIDIRQQAYTSSLQQSLTEDEGEDKLEIVINEEQELDNDNRYSYDTKDPPVNLPKRQRELYMRIQAQQKENVLTEQKEEHSDSEQSNIDWYSDDSNEGKLTIKCDEDMKEKEEEPVSTNISPAIKPSEMVEKLGDLSQINISEEVTKLLSSIRQNNAIVTSPKDTKPKDPRQTSVSAPEEPKTARLDPRKLRGSSTEEKVKHEKISIYEQGSIDTDSLGRDVDLRSIDKDLDLRPNFGDLDFRGSSSSGRPDVDLRQLSLPFKAMQNYTPATEIDASFSSHPPISWMVHIIDIPKPDYTGLKLSKQEAQATGDPRLRKIFRLDVEDKDSPASPKQSPKSTPTVRVDPRIRKAEEPKIENPIMSYAQQMNVLQGSSFYQNLTSNQKVTLNQELSNRDQGGNTNSNEQVLAGVLSALGLMQNQSGVPNINGNVLSLLSTISNISQMGINPNVLQNPNINVQNANPPMLGQNPNIITQSLPQNPNIIPGQQVNPNILNQGAAPGIPNIPPDFQINFDPRNGGLLGNAPPFVNFQQDNQNFNFNDDFFPEGGGNFNNNRDGRFNRDNRPPRRGRNFNRNNRNNFRNRNRSNRGHTPP